MQALINTANKGEVNGGESGDNEINPSNLSTLKKSTKAGYLTFRDVNRGGSNTKMGVKALKSSDYLILDTKKGFNYLWHAFT